METQSITQEAFLIKWKQKFFTIWSGQAVSLFGSSLVQFAMVWYLTEKTGSATILATATLVAMLPQVVLGPMIGTLVDRWNRRWVMVIADASIAIATLVLAILFALGVVQIWQIYVLLLLRSLGGAFHWPAMSASTSLMVPKEQLSRVAGMNQTLQGVVNIIAPPTGAVLLGILPLQGVLAIDIATALVAITPLLFIDIPRPVREIRKEVENGIEKGTFWQDFKDGFAYVAAWPGLMAILFMAMLINFLLTPTGSLMPLLITKHFGLGALQLGFVDSAEGIGMIVGGVLLGIWGGFKRKIATSMMGIVGIGMGCVLVGLAPSNLYFMALVGMSIAGLMLPMTNGPLQAIIQSAVRPDMQGRVMALIGSLATAMTPLSLMVAGPVSDAIGIQTWYIFSGVACLLMGLAGYTIPAIMNVEENRETNAGAPQPAPRTSPAD